LNSNPSMGGSMYGMEAMLREWMSCLSSCTQGSEAGSLHETTRTNRCPALHDPCMIACSNPPFASFSTGCS
jgi:hypothetical protein